ncbi:MAG: acyl-ACP--UDP-N-acetylglucosamine O-acyltransferase [Pseudomonadota bacterium]|nr:MAG: acyl-ACP--UDP-N-acetylglucosamine O-acyltransferase [Pseudomonadota bacterium]
MSIHPTAIIDPGARLDESVSVGPYSVVGADVEIGAGTHIGPHVVVAGPTRIGNDNRIFQFASIGDIPQDKKYRDEPTLLEIGDRNTIRECATINRGTVQGGGVTRIGDDNWLMAYIHIAHDCLIGNSTIFANSASLAGHVRVEDYAILGGFTLVHQFCAIGAHAFSAMGSSIAKDVPPFVMVSGSPAHPHGLNSEGLKRRGIGEGTIRALRDAYRLLYRSGLGLEEAKARIRESAPDAPELRQFQEFLDSSQRSIVR